MTRLPLLSLVLVMFTLSLSAEVEEPPNVLLIILDDLNDWVGHLEGHRNALTPNIDRLASEGVAFLDAHASSPLCGPSRAAFLSGMSAATSGYHNNLSRFTDEEILMGRENLPQFFHRAGYSTYASGKVFHYHFPEFWDESLDKGPRMYKAGQPKRNGLEIPGIFDWGPLPVADEEMDDYKMAQFAIDRLNEAHDRPFFIACGIYLPHLPWYAPEEYFEPFPVDGILIPPDNPNEVDDLPNRALQMARNKYQEVVNDLPPEALREAVQAYLAASHFADAQIGRILDALAAGPYAEDTVVVLIGDHGNHLGEKDRWHKDTLWQESTRAPFIVYAPGMAGNGHPSKRMASLLDLYPTLAELIGKEPPPHLEGRSLVPLLEDPVREWPFGVVTHRRPGQASVRTEDWCYIRYDDGSEELYDRRNDPSEWVNLAQTPQYERIKEEMSALMSQN